VETRAHAFRLLLQDALFELPAQRATYVPERRSAVRSVAPPVLDVFAAPNDLPLYEKPTFAPAIARPLANLSVDVSVDPLLLAERASVSRHDVFATRNTDSR
jgi:hypothetical protein